MAVIGNFYRPRCGIRRASPGSAAAGRRWLGSARPFPAAAAGTLPFAAFAQKKITSLLPKETTGEIADPDAYLRWETATGKPWQYEASLSSWHFMTTVRYKLNGEIPELVGYRHYDGEVFFYALPAALFMLIGIYLRKLRG